MSLLRSQRDFYGDPTYNPFERPSMPLASLALDGVLGGNSGGDSGEQVDPLKGFAIPTAFRCIAIIATVIASLPIEEIDDETQDAEVWTLFKNLTSYTAFEIKEIMGAHLAGWGNFFARKVYSTIPARSKTLTDLVPIYPGDVKVIRVKGVKTYRIKKRNEDGSLAVGAASADGQANPVYDDIPAGPDCPIFHVAGMGYDGLQGVCPILLAGQTFGTTIAADRLAARFYSRGQQLGGILKVKVPLTKQGQADAMKQSWRNSHGGVQNAGDVAVLDSETDFQAITIAPEALQFLQSRQWQATEVARMWGVPPHLIGELVKSTSWGAGIEQQNIGFVTYTIRGYTDRIEQRCEREFGLVGKTYEFDLDRMLRGSMMERFQAYGQAIGWGWMLRSEARLNERMKALDPKFGLDTPLTPAAMNGALSDGPMGPPGNTAGALNSQAQDQDPDEADGSDDQDDDAPPSKPKGKSQ